MFIALEVRVRFGVLVVDKQNTILKYTLDVKDTQAIEMPKNAKILTVKTQHGHVRLWALVNKLESKLETRKIAIYGTGNPISENCGEYIATFQLYDGDLVFHAFEVN